MGQVWDMVEAYRDRHRPYPPSLRQMADQLEVAPGTFNAWQDPQRLPARDNIAALATLLGVPYLRVLDGFLHDTGYLPERQQAAQPLRLAAKRGRSTGRAARRQQDEDAERE